MGDGVELEAGRIVARFRAHLASFGQARSDTECRRLLETFCHEHDALADALEREASRPAPRPWVAEVAAELRQLCAVVRGALATMNEVR